ENELVRTVATVVKDKIELAALGARKGGLARLKDDTIPFFKRHDMTKLASQDRAIVERALGGALSNFIQARRELSSYLLEGDKDLSYEMLVRNEIDLF